MRDDSVVDLINNIKKIKKQDLKDFAELTDLDGKEINLLTSSELFIEQHESAEIVEELELSLASFVLNEDSTVNQTVKNKLSQIDINIIRLNSGTFCLDFGNYCIAFSI